MIDILKILKTLSVKRPIFHSEADFQHELAWEIHTLYPDAKIRIEKPSGNNLKREHIDIEVLYKALRIAIELKYKKTVINWKHSDENYSLKADSAQDICRYDYIKDIVRLEEFVVRHPDSIGYAIMLTNDNLYWKKSKGKVSEEFLLDEGRLLKANSEMNWHEITSKGTKSKREKGLSLSNNYEIQWSEYSKIDGNKKNDFKYLLVQVTNEIPI